MDWRTFVSRFVEVCLMLALALLIAGAAVVFLAMLLTFWRML